MNPAGVIVTYITRQDWKGKKLLKKIGIIFFNLCLFVFQLIFMVVGTAIGKVKQKAETTIYIDIIIIGVLAAVMYFMPRWWNIPIVAIVAVAIFRGIEWAVVWRAAQASHVRLVLEKVPDDVLLLIGSYWTANFGYPKMEIQAWYPEWNDGKRFEYREPTFTLPQEAIAKMIDYAEGEVGKEYDDLQLGSPVLNFPIWVFYPPLWGREKIGWLNREGGREFCSSGVTACLRWADKYIHPDKLLFFFDYDTAMVMPCMIVISEKWRKR